MTAPLQLKDYALPLADPWALSVLGIVLALLLCWMLQEARDGQKEWKAKREVCSHGPAALLEEGDEIDGGLSTSARAEIPKPGEDWVWLLGDGGGWWGSGLSIPGMVDANMPSTWLIGYTGNFVICQLIADFSASALATEEPS